MREKGGSRVNDMEICCFLSVARTGSFTASARELSSTQQAVSRNIQALENELGFPLLNRGGSAITLTWAGERFMRWRTEHDDQLSALERQSRRMSPEGLDELYVAWNDWTGCPKKLAEDLRGFCQNYPNVRLHTRQGTTKEVMDMLLTDAADIAVLPEDSAHDLKGLIASPPFASEPLYVISRDLDELPPPETLASMRHLAAPLGEPDEESIRRRVRMFCAELGVVPKQIEVMPNARSAFSQLLCGNCYTIAPLVPGLDRLRAVRLEGQQMRLVFVVPQRRVSPWVSLFESYVRQRRERA